MRPSAWTFLFLAFLLLRTVPAPGATFEVTSVADSGPGSLRQAILDANAAGVAPDGEHSIVVTIPGDVTIAPLSPLPMIRVPLSLAGLIIDGSSAGSGDGIVATAPLRIKFFVIGNFSGTAIDLRAGGELWSVSVGISGGIALPNGGIGIRAAAATKMHYVDVGASRIGIELTGSGHELRGVFTGQGYGFQSELQGLGNREAGIVALISDSVIGGVDDCDAFGMCREEGVWAVGNGGTGIVLSGSNIQFDLEAVENGGHGIELALSDQGPGRHMLVSHGNAGDGVRVIGRNAFFEIDGIYNNGGLGIDLGGDGPTPNDGDPGPDSFLDVPVLTGAVANEFWSEAEGYVQTTPNTEVWISVFAPGTRTESGYDYACDPSGFGEGNPNARHWPTQPRYWWNLVRVTTDGSGYAAFAAEGAPVGFPLSAVASTSAATSEFSRCITVQQGPVKADLRVTQQLLTPLPIRVGDQIVSRIEVFNDGPAPATGLDPKLFWSFGSVSDPRFEFESSSTGSARHRILPGGSLTYFSSGTVIAPVGTVIQHSVTVPNNNEPDPDLSNGSASILVTVEEGPAADVDLAIEGSPTYDGGRYITRVTFTVRNLSDRWSVGARLAFSISREPPLDVPPLPPGGAVVVETWLRAEEGEHHVTVVGATPDGNLANNSFSFRIVAADATAIPTLSEIVLLALAFLLAGVGAWRLR